MDSKFDMRRFLMLLRLDVMADRKYAVRLFFGFTLVYFFCFFPVLPAGVVYAVVDAGRVSDALGVVALLCLLAAVAALYWLSYRLFCRTQIVGHKWFSL